MTMEQWLNTAAGDTAANLMEITSLAAGEGGFSGYGMKSKLKQLIWLLRCAMYPNIYSESLVRPQAARAFVTSRLQQAAELLSEMCASVMTATCTQQNKGTPVCDACAEKADRAVCDFMDSLCEIARVLNTDIQAAYEGDPAARSFEEILLAYPAFEAISIFRLAHRLYELQVPLLPRMMTEYAHQHTGIDIHPGASIGEYFFIDHGTGVVIGETTVIGHHVKLYQGVTLGAKSFDNDENGNPVKGVKRHPQVGNHVVIYAGATILGGDTVIGDGCIIGGSVWLTHSVPAGQVVYNR